MNQKMILAVVLLAGFLILYFLTPLRHFFSRENLDGLKIWIQSMGTTAPLVFILIYIFSIVFCLPGSILSILAGIIFNVFWGTVFVIIASNLGSFIAFYISRYLGRETVQKLFHGRLAKLDEKIGLHGFSIVLWLRLFPFAPYTFLNYALGFTTVGVKDYVLANLIGMIPGIFVYVSLGNAAIHMSLTDPKVWTKMEVWGPFVLAMVLALLPKIFKKKQKDLQRIIKEENPSKYQDKSDHLTK